MTIPGMQKLRSLKKAKSFVQLPSIKRQRKAEQLRGENIKVSPPRRPVAIIGGTDLPRQETTPSADDQASTVALAPAPRSGVASASPTPNVSREDFYTVHPLRSHPSREFVESPHRVSRDSGFARSQPDENNAWIAVTDSRHAAQIPYRQPLQDALLSVNPLSDEDAPQRPTIYGAGSRYHAYSRPETFGIPPNEHRQNVQPVLAPRLPPKSRSTPNLLASGRLRPVAEHEATWPLPGRPLNDRAAKRQGRVFVDSELPFPLRAGHLAPDTPITPLSPRDEEDLHIWSTSLVQPSPQSASFQPHCNSAVRPLEEVIHASINRRRAKQAQKKIDNSQHSSFPRQSLNTSTSNTDEASSTFSEFLAAQDNNVRIKRNSSAEMLSLPGHYGQGHLPLSPAETSTLNSSAPSSLFLSRQFDELVARRNQNRGAELFPLPGHYGPLPTPSITSESHVRTSTLTATTDSTDTRSLRSRVAQILQDHERNHARHSTGARDSTWTDTSSTKSLLDKIAEALVHPGRHSRHNNGPIVGPIARGVRPKTSRDVLRRKGPLEDLREEFEIVRKSPARPSSISTIEMLNGAARKVKKTAKVAQQGWRNVFYKGQVDVKVMKTVLSSAIEPALGGFGCDFTAWGR